MHSTLVALPRSLRDFVMWLFFSDYLDRRGPCTPGPVLESGPGVPPPTPAGIWSQAHLDGCQLVCSYELPALCPRILRPLEGRLATETPLQYARLCRQPGGECFPAGPWASGPGPPPASLSCQSYSPAYQRPCTRPPGWLGPQLEADSSSSARARRGAAHTTCKSLRTASHCVLYGCCTEAEPPCFFLFCFFFEKNGTLSI
jgi:hypothetical protein